MTPSPTPKRGWRSFDRVARIYAGAEALLFGRRLQAARTRGLSDLNAPERVLLLGEGDGRFAEALLTRFDACQVTIVDKSERMLELAVKRLFAHSARVNFMQADALHCAFEGPFDLVTTLFFLDCFDTEAQQRLFERLDPVLSHDATWLYADFDPGNGNVSGLGHRLTIWGLYAGFGLLTDIGTVRYHDPLPLFDEYGWGPLPPERVGLLRTATLRRTRAPRQPASPRRTASPPRA